MIRGELSDQGISLDAEPIAFRVEHLDPVLPGHPGSFTFEGGTEALETSPLPGEYLFALVHVGATRDHVHVEMDPLIPSTTVVSLEENTRAYPIWIDTCVQVMTALLGDADLVGEVIPGLEAFRWGLQDISESLGPETGKDSWIVTGEDDLDLIAHGTHCSCIEMTAPPSTVIHTPRSQGRS